MLCARSLTVLLVLGLAGCGGFTWPPEGHGPGWVGRNVGSLTDKLGNPDRTVRLPPPSLSTVYLYTGGAEPGFAVCERNYYIRGGTVVGYREHGTEPSCNRSGGRPE